MKKYYCPRKWYRNVAGKRPVVDGLGGNRVAVILVAHRDNGPNRIANIIANPSYGWEWEWDNSHNMGTGRILYFKVERRAEALVENPSVQLHEMLNARTG